MKALSRLDGIIHIQRLVQCLSLGGSSEVTTRFGHFFPQQSKGEEEVGKMICKVQSCPNILLLGNFLPEIGYST